MTHSRTIVSALIIALLVVVNASALPAPMVKISASDLTSPTPLSKAHLTPKKIGNIVGCDFTSRSQLAYALPKSLQQGTIVLTFLPSPSWFASTSRPQILFQIGENHWSANNLTIIREPDGRLIFRSHDGANRQTVQQIGADVFQRDTAYSIAWTWDAKKSAIVSNGVKLSETASPAIPEVWTKLFSVGCSADHAARPNWGFDGVLFNASLYDCALSDEELVAVTTETMIDITPAALSSGDAAIINDAVPYIETVGKIVHIGTRDWELQFNIDGTPLRLYDKRAQRFLIKRWVGDAIWSLRFANATTPDISSKGVRAQFGVVDRNGRKTAQWTYFAGDSVATVKTFVTPDVDGAISFNYAVTNADSRQIAFVYFPVLCGFVKSDDGYVTIPRWEGELRMMKNFEFMCWGGPGHLSMLFIGLKVAQSTVLLYAADPTGCIKFAIADDNRSGPKGHVNLAWENRDWIEPRDTWRSPFDFRLCNVGDTGLGGMAEKYREWASKQSWFVTYAEKVKKTPSVAKSLNGVIKMAGFEAVGRDGNTYATKEWKEKHAKILTFTYPRFLEVADTIEKLYGVQPCYRYDGWWGRFDSRYPEYFPVDAELGDFKQFTDTNNAKGRLVFLHTNPIQWDDDIARFTTKKMASGPNNDYNGQVWSRNRLYFASPNPIHDEEVAAEKQIASFGVNGIFEDVIGCTTMVDHNPYAGYEYLERDSGTVALNKLAMDLRAATPGMFRGTEGGEERRMAAYDAFMFGPGDVPLFTMVYGDCIANMEGIGGGADGADLHFRAVYLLQGIVLGLDGRYEWASKYSATAQMVLQSQLVLKSVVGQRIIDYTWDATRTEFLSQWADAITVANLGKATKSIVRENTTLGKIEVVDLQPDAAVLVTRDGQLIAWNCRKVVLNGKTIFEIDGASDVAICRSREAMHIARTLPVKNAATLSVKVTLGEPTVGRAAVMLPEKSRVNVESVGDAMQLAIPADHVLELR